MIVYANIGPYKIYIGINNIFQEHPFIGSSISISENESLDGVVHWNVILGSVYFMTIVK